MKSNTGNGEVYNDYNTSSFVKDNRAILDRTSNSKTNGGLEIFLCISAWTSGYFLRWRMSIEIFIDLAILSTVMVSLEVFKV